MRQQLLNCQGVEDCFHSSNKNAAGEPKWPHRRVWDAG
jgi:hypothetical protein